MGKLHGYLESPRQMPDRRPVQERLRDWDEVYEARTEEESRRQGGRCMDCGVPFCQQGCPLGNRIPDFNDLVYRGRWKEAWLALRATNDFPEFTGRLCPAPCEAACTLTINDAAVTIEQLEKEIVERAFAEGWIVPRPPVARTGKRVAVVGSGPAGLAAASALNRAGHEVIVYERSDRVGGLLRYGIPDFKLEKRIIDRRLEVLQAEGVRFAPGVEAGRQVTWLELGDEHDAVLVAVGAGRARDLDVPGRELPGVHFAMDFLEAQNRTLADGHEPISAEGQDVVILGGGDTGSDCLGTALRQGARSVVQVEIVDAPPKVRAETNPWPHWPVVFRVSSSQEEGGNREFSVRTTHLAGNGRVEWLHAERLDTGEEFVLPCDMLVLAMGFLSPVTDSLREQVGLELDRRGNVAVDRAFRTSRPGFYAAGDASRGASLIVWAISDGREAARHIDADLMGLDVPRLPTKGRDQPF